MPDQRRIVLVVLCVGYFLVLLDVTIVSAGLYVLAAVATVAGVRA